MIVSVNIIFTNTSYSALSRWLLLYHASLAGTGIAFLDAVTNRKNTAAHWGIAFLLVMEVIQL